MKASPELYYKLCATIDFEVKRNVIMPSDLYDASIVFLATVAMRCKDPTTDLEEFVKMTTSRVAAAIHETAIHLAKNSN